MMTIEEEIHDTEARLFKAMTCSDVAALDRLLHEDLLFVTPDGQTITKAMDLASHKARNMVVTEADYTVEQISLIGDTAVVSIVLRATGTMLGQPIDGTYRYIRIWKWFGIGWQVIGGSCTVCAQ
jgi:ketosteroid isomerase-like protein